MRELRADGDRVAIFDQQRRYESRGRRGHFDVDFVRGNLDDCIAFVDEIARLHAEFDYGTLGDGLAHLGKHHVNDFRRTARNGRGSGRRRDGVSFRGAVLRCAVRLRLSFARVDFSQNGTDGDSVAFSTEKLSDDAGCGRGNFHVHFVGRHVDESVALVYEIADVLTPFDDGAFGD